MTTDTTSNDAITADEIALYDRQIRLWGVKAQEHLRKANILLVGMKALANEVAKNLVLAGINSLTIIDHEIVTERDLGAQFFLTGEDVGKNRAEAAAPRVRELNPRVDVRVDTADVTAKDPAFVQEYDLIIVTDTNFPTASTLNASCRFLNKPFYAAGVHGFYGYIFADLVSHEYIIESDMPNKPTAPGRESFTRSVTKVDIKDDGGKRKQIVERRETYSPFILANSSPLSASIRDARRKLKKVTPLLSCLRALWDFESQFLREPTATPEDLRTFTTFATLKHKELELPSETLTAEFLRKFLQNLGAQLVPVTAMVGGLLAQDVINAISKREQPIQNLCLFDGDTYTVPVYALHPESFDGQNVVNTLGAVQDVSNGVVNLSAQSEVVVL